VTEFQESLLPLLGQNETPRVQEAVKQPNYISGHRKRLRARFCSGGAEAMPDYELLEMMLFRTIRRADVKPIANALLSKFDNLNHVLAASEVQLKSVNGVGDAVVSDIKLIETIAHRMTRARVMKREIISSWDALLDYCHSKMAHRSTEQFRILFLDTKNTLIADEEQAKGTVNHVPVYPREVVKRALELNASAIILVHNHPSGDPTPSQSDLDMTAQIDNACRALSIVLHDHLIIGHNTEISFRSEGLI